MHALAVTMLLATQTPGGGVCPTGRATSIGQAIRELSRWPLPSSSAPAGVVAYPGQRSTVADETHIAFAWRPVVGATREFVWALPLPWKGSVRIRFDDDGACGNADAVFVEQRLDRLVWRDRPARVTLQRTAPGGRRADKEVAIAGYEESASWLVLHTDETDIRVPIGSVERAFDEVRLVDVDAYQRSLDDVGIVTLNELAQAPGKQGDRFRFALLRARLRDRLESLLPRDRLAALGRVRTSSLSPHARRTYDVWRSYFRAATLAPATTAQLLVADDVDELWIEGTQVFTRTSGARPLVEVPAPIDGVRVWIVARAAIGEAPRVHDTWAVLRGGERYTVRDTFVASLSPGDRRECMRVTGGKLRWREVSGTASPWLSTQQSFKPSGSAAERAIAVTDADGAAVVVGGPLVYSYTHPGTYKWSVQSSGAVSLSLTPDLRVCDEESEAAP